jgi:formylglycine-generating enzyme required for sulfatase activity
MGKYQVTQEQYQTVMGTNPSNFTAAVSGESGTPGKLPMERVTWFDAIEFCNKLSVLEGLQEVYTISGRTPASGYPITNATVTADWSKNGYRLPTEAEWEYACRAGTTTAYNTGAAISDNTGWYTANSGSKTHQVGLKPANTWGLYDMHGNVWEWCWDWYGSYSSGAQTDPLGASSGSYRVARGGGWDSSAGDLRSANRLTDNPGNRLNDLGFRLVRP